MFEDSFIAKFDINVTRAVIFPGLGIELYPIPNDVCQFM